MATMAMPVRASKTDGTLAPDILQKISKMMDRWTTETCTCLLRDSNDTRYFKRKKKLNLTLATHGNETLKDNGRKNKVYSIYATFSIINDDDNSRYQFGWAV